MPAFRPVAVRFWEKVNKGESCWMWCASSRNKNGYGALAIKRRSQLAHRVSWELNVGVIPDGMRVLHACDQPRCVRPDQLFLGTQRDNIADSKLPVKDAATPCAAEGSAS